MYICGFLRGKGIAAIAATAMYSVMAIPPLQAETERTTGKGDEDENCGISNVAVFWNTENFFDPFDDPLKDDDEFTPVGTRRWTWKRFRAKAEGIAKTIYSIKDHTEKMPVIVGLCEVENGFVLNYLVNRTVLASAEYGYIHYDSPDERGIDTALLYKRGDFKAISSRAIPVIISGSRKTRDILYVKGCTGNDTLHIFVNHWPSRFGGEDNTSYKRETAAKVLRSICDSILNENPHAAIIAMGDFNDTFRSESILSLSRILRFPQIRHAGTENAARHIGGTNKYRNIWETIDLIMVSGNIRLKDSSYTVFSPEHLIEKDTKYLGYKIFRTYTGPRYNGGYSDHLPVIATFRTVK